MTKLNERRKVEFVSLYPEDIEGESIIVLPRIVESENANKLFKKALKMERLTYKKRNNKYIVKAVHMYQEAYDNGLVEAGINLLRIIFTVQAHRENISEDDSFNIRIRNILDNMEIDDYKIYEYYQALIEYLCANKFEERSHALYRMEEAASYGNEYACTFMNLL